MANVHAQSASPSLHSPTHTKGKEKIGKMRLPNAHGMMHQETTGPSSWWTRAPSQSARQSWTWKFRKQWSRWKFRHLIMLRAPLLHVEPRFERYPNVSKFAQRPLLRDSSCVAGPMRWRNDKGYHLHESFRQTGLAREEKNQTVSFS